MALYSIDTLIEETRRLAAEFRRTTGTMLPVSGEIARYDVCHQLNLNPCEERSCGYDATGNGARDCGSQPVSRVLSRVIIPLGCTSPRTSSDLPESGAGHTIGFLFGLAPGGVCPAVRVTTNAVRSYRTFSPLPTRHPEVSVGGIFSVALSVDSRRPVVIWHPALWSPDFPRSCTVGQLIR